MRYELNFDEDKIIDIEAIGDDGVLDLNDCCKIMNEQQDTIKKLQDLCGESDGENMKLRIENKRLQEENKELEDEHDDFSNFLIDKGLEFEFEKWCKDE